MLSELQAVAKRLPISHIESKVPKNDTINVMLGGVRYGQNASGMILEGPKPYPLVGAKMAFEFLHVAAVVNLFCTFFSSFDSFFNYRVP
jgi:hypothetical protein